MANTPTATPIEKRISDSRDKVKKFISECVTRNGIGFEIDTIQFNSMGIPVTIKGKIKEGSDIRTAYWNAEGVSMENNYLLDLVTEEKTN